MKNNDPLLIDTGRGFSILYRERYLYSNTDPEKRAIMRAEKTVLQNSTLYILTSPLLFYGITEILSRLPDDSHIICFELSKNLLNLSKDHIPDVLLNSKFGLVEQYFKEQQQPATQVPQQPATQEQQTPPSTVHKGQSHGE